MENEVLITGARVIDGTGNPWFYADVVLAGDRIAQIAPPGRLDRTTAREVVAAEGMVVCPGFIDIQSHSISVFMSDGRSLSKVTQGVTTEIMGELWTPSPFGGRRTSAFAWGDVPEGSEEQAQTWTRFGQWLDHLAERGVSVNFGSFVGGATVREYGKGWDAGEPTEDELDVMRGVTAEAMEDGAFGVATALIYPPNAYSTDRELTAVARVVGEYGGLYITHIRSEGDFLLESLRDTITLSREAQVPVEIYHLKATGAPNWPKMMEAIALIESARAEGVDIAADMYPYIAGGTGLDALLPYWASEGGRLWENLDDPETRARIRADMAAGGLEAVFTTQDQQRAHVMPVDLRQPENAPYIGKRLPEIAAMRNQHWIDATLDLLVSEQQRILTVYFSMSEENVTLQLKQPWIKISTDAGGIDPAAQKTPTHPRAYGTYTRVLGHYVREKRALTLEDAIRKMSSAVADRLGLRDRGLLRENCFADVVVFDPNTVADRATFTDSHQLSTGIRDVWVNGRRVLKDGQHTGALPGRPVYGSGKR